MEINQQTPQDELLTIINDPNTADDVYEKASKEHRRRLLEKKQEAEALEQRISEVVKAVRNLNISFEKFVESKTAEGDSAFDVAQIKAYASKKRWIQDIPMTAESKEETGGEEKTPIIVGTFKLADYGFVMPKKTGTDIPFSTATEFKWDFNRQYAGTGWELKFIGAIVAKGLDDIQQHLTPEFKEWLETAEVPTRGPFANTKIYKNKRKFYKRFGFDENMNPIKLDK